MKKAWIGFGLLALLVFFSAWMSEGCHGTLPAIPAVVATPLPSGVISNFSNGTLNMNPTLEGGDGGYFISETYGGAAGEANMIDGSNTPDILFPNPGDGSAYAVHIYGPITDITPTGYPDMALYGFLKNNTSNLPNSEWYDCSFSGMPLTFTRIRFDMNIGADDTNTQTLFGVGSSLQVPPTTAPGGTCPPNFSNNCYDYFWANYKNGTCTSFLTSSYPIYPGIRGHGWQPVTFLIGSLAGGGYNGNATSNSLGSLPENSKEALFLIWKFSDNGTAPFDSYTDFWVDNVEFVP